jgi:hypothetical protein
VRHDAPSAVSRLFTFVPQEYLTQLGSGSDQNDFTIRGIRSRQPYGPRANRADGNDMPHDRSESGLVATTCRRAGHDDRYKTRFGPARLFAFRSVRPNGFEHLRPWQGSERGGVGEVSPGARRPPSLRVNPPRETVFRNTGRKLYSFWPAACHGGDGKQHRPTNKGRVADAA